MRVRFDIRIKVLMEIYSPKRRFRSDVSVADTKLGFASLSADAHIGVSWLDNEPSMQHRACTECCIFGDCRTPKSESFEVDNSVVIE